MLFSEFAPLGLFELSNEEPIAERIYRSLVAAHGDQFDMTPGESRQEAWCYATAMSKARVHKALEMAGAQAFANEVDLLIDTREAEFKIVPPFDATPSERRDVIKARRRRPKTWTKARIEERLRELLGDDLIAYRPTPLAEVARWPAALGDQPQNLQRPTVTRKLVRLTVPITFLGAPLAGITYDTVDGPREPGSAPAGLVDGDVLVVGSGLGLAETVVVSDCFPGNFTATFTKPHPSGVLCTTAPFPKWISTKRHNLVVVTEAAAVDLEKRRMVDEEMRRMVRAPSTWDIVQSADGLTTKTFRVGVSPIGAQTIGDITL